MEQSLYKYTRTGSIRIWQKDRRHFIEHRHRHRSGRYPRLGERGFTGYNGRLDKKSTGIGLYLCKEISRRLSHTLTIESEPGKGTRVTIDFATRQLQAE
ncbi:MAG: ATP-binding protein [Clostridia bacterium]